eukprot:gene9716-biopygen7708
MDTPPRGSLVLSARYPEWILPRGDRWSSPPDTQNGYSPAGIVGSLRPIPRMDTPPAGNRWSSPPDTQNGYSPAGIVGPLRPNSEWILPRGHRWFSARYSEWILPRGDRLLNGYFPMMSITPRGIPGARWAVASVIVEECCHDFVHVLCVHNPSQVFVVERGWPHEAMVRCCMTRPPRVTKSSCGGPSIRGQWTERADVLHAPSYVCTAIPVVMVRVHEMPDRTRPFGSHAVGTKRCDERAGFEWRNHHLRQLVKQVATRKFPCQHDRPGVGSATGGYS